MEHIHDFENIPKLVNYRKLDDNNYVKESPNLIREIRKSESKRE